MQNDNYRNFPQTFISDLSCGLGSSISMVIRYAEEEEGNCYSGKCFIPDTTAAPVPESCFSSSPAFLQLSSPPRNSEVVPPHRPAVKSFSGLNPTKIQARPTSSATTRFTVTHGFRTWCSEPGGLPRSTGEPEPSSAAGSPRRPSGAEEGSPQRCVGGGVQVDAIAGHLLAQAEDQRREID